MNPSIDEQAMARRHVHRAPTTSRWVLALCGGLPPCSILFLSNAHFSVVLRVVRLDDPRCRFGRDPPSRTNYYSSLNREGLWVAPQHRGHSPLAKLQCSSISKRG